MTSTPPSPTGAPQLNWSTTLNLSPLPTRTQLPGDKILLPPSALEALLAAAPLVETTTARRNGPLTAAFDPYNPYTYEAERWAREQATERTQALPQPLTFRLVEPRSGRVVYAGIREFSAEEGTVVVSEWIRGALGLPDRTNSNGKSLEAGDHDDDEVVANGGDAANGTEQEQGVHITVIARQLDKGTFVKLRPLEAGYDVEDWKALLEQYLRANFTTLTNGEVLNVPGGHGMGRISDNYKFLVDGFKPDGDGICIVDTDLEVDIEALNEDQARETVRRIAEKMQRAPGTEKGSSTGGIIDLFQTKAGRVLPGEWVDYTLPSWDRSQGVEVELSAVEDDACIDLYISPLASRQRAKPRSDEYTFSEVGNQFPKRIRIQPTNTELEDAEAIQVSVHAYTDSEDTETSSRAYTISVNPFDPAKSMDVNGGTTQETETPPNPEDIRCKNCRQWVPQQRMVLHENFCFRNNILCPKGCSSVFQKSSPEWKDHWHCPHDNSFGNTPLAKRKHDTLSHTPASCPSCSRSYPSLSLLASHRTSDCPGKLILCRFCHLQVPQEGDPDSPNAEAILSGLTPHELADGARTTECHLCGRITRLRDMDTHLKHHELSKASKPPPVPCRNALCGRTLHGAAARNGDTRVNGVKDPNDVGLCSRCFGPLYVAMHDPEGKALRRRIERRYLTQLLTGCGKDWCRNEFCRVGRKNEGLPEKGTSTKEALPMVKPELAGVVVGEGVGIQGTHSPLHFCTDEGAQKNRLLAAHLAGEGVYAFEWIVGALEAAGGDLSVAREWLNNWAPKRT